MKYAFMTFSTPELDLKGVLDVAQRFGYDGVEIRIDSKHRHGVERESNSEARAASKDAATAAGISLCCVATSCRFANPETRDESVAIAKQAIDLAGDIGAPVIRVFGGQCGEGVGREQAIDLVSESLSNLASQAQARGVTVCMETHDDWCDPAHVAAVLSRVNHPNVAANWDIMHPVRTGLATIDESFEALKPWIRHIHFHDGKPVDGKNQLQPIGSGEIDHKRAVQLLQGTDYQGFLSGEWINWQPYEEHLPRELATIKSYEA